MSATRHLLELLRAPASVEALALAQWDTVLQLARRTNLVARLAETVDAVAALDRVPPKVRPHLASALALSRHQRQAIAWEARHIENALAPLDIPVVLLKGSAYAAAGLAASRGRLFGDVDVLVAEEGLAEVEAALMLHGWTSATVDPYDLRYYREWMHELAPMMHRGRGTVIDVHHNILPRTARSVPDARKLIAASVQLEYSRLRILEPCDLVIHSATHLFHEGELRNGLRDLLDLEGLVAEFCAEEPEFIPRLIDRASELGLAWPVRLAFRSMAATLGTTWPQGQALTAGASRSGSDRLLDLAYRYAFEPDHPSCNNARVALARAALYLRGHALRMPPTLLVRHLARKAFMRLYRNTSRTPT